MAVLKDMRPCTQTVQRHVVMKCHFMMLAKLTGLPVTYISCVCELRAFVIYLGIKFTWVAWLT